MSQLATINPRIIEAPYCEALVLVDEVRMSFDKSVRAVNDSDDEGLARIALSCEGLGTITRMMHGWHGCSTTEPI